MKIEKLILKDTNCYLVSTDSAAIVIDPGYEDIRTVEFLEKNADKERLILITHAHFDHIGGADILREKTGVKIAIGEFDNPALSDNIVNEGTACGVYIEPFSADILITDNEEFSVGDIFVKAYLTKGHTIGGLCYLMDDNLFTGDILFHRGFGNTCFHGGSRREIVNSLNFLFNNFAPDTKVFSGHGDTTTIGSEKSYYGR